ncbi:MAG: triose-phosphate isomerase [Clostridia bacterium]|jgi:triosephosphate isomerase|nr:triose-phosphate isomerase [Clostridia bacterium]
MGYKRRKVIAGNWKMNLTPSEAKKFVGSLYEKVKNNRGCDIVVCVPAIDLPVVAKMCAGTAIKVGGQNVHFAKSGAYTGEISADMLVDVGAKYVIIGHSERRQYFGETDETVNLRTKAALEAGLNAIVCVGECLAEREQGITEEVVARQTKLALLDIAPEQMKQIIIAYEPVWAIGTGKTATAQQAEEVCKLIRNVIASKYGKSVARATIIQYGGSMNAKNAAELLAMENIDGGLIGGASLKPDDFAVIVEAAQ